MQCMASPQAPPCASMRSMRKHLFAAFASFTAACSLDAQVAEGKPKSVALKAENLDDASLVPLTLRTAVRGDRLPALVGRQISVRTNTKQIEVDLDDSGRFATKATPKKGTLLTISADRRDGDTESAGTATWLLAGDAAGYWIAPARMLFGTVQKQRIELLDADHDGRFDGERDWVRLGNEPFHRFASTDRWIGSGDRIFTLAVATSTRSTTATLDALTRESTQSVAQWAALTATNAYRLANGLGPMRLDAELCDGCQKHALYLQINKYDYSKPWDGVGSHNEDPSKPGFTEEGLRAAHSCATSGGPDAAAAILRQTATMLHRTSYLGPAGSGLGVGSVQGGSGELAGYSVTGGPKPQPSQLDELVAVPAPGSTGVPLLVGGERPPVERDPAFYDRARGYPISVSFGRAGCTKARIRLFDARGKEVAGTLFSPDSPIHSTRPENGNSAFFVADAPLSGGTKYEAEFTCDHPHGAVNWRWTFATR